VKKRKPGTLTSLQFFSRLVWLDGRNLLETIEPYRREIFTKVFDTFRKDGSPLYNLILTGRGKKNNKTTDVDLASLYTTVVRRSVQGSDAFILASDADQANDNLDLMKKLVRANPELRAEFNVLKDRLNLKDGSGSARILAAGDVSGLHGKQAAIIGVDEFHTQADWSVLEALQPDPTRRDCLQWLTSYDLIAGERGVPLFDLKEAGFARSDPRMLFSWYSGDKCTDPNFAALPPEQRANPSMSSWPAGEEYLEQQRRRLPLSMFRRLHLNLGGSESAFVTLEQWDRCVDPELRRVVSDRSLPVFVAVDASTKHDATAVVAVTFDRALQKPRLVWHRVFQPSPDDPLDFEQTIEATLLWLRDNFRVVKMVFDPWQMQATAQRLGRAGVIVEDFPQTPPNLTRAAQNLFELITGQNLVLYPDEGMRVAISRAVAIEGTRGWRIGKEKQTHKIDVIIALMMACHAAVRGQAQLPTDWTSISQQICAAPPYKPSEAAAILRLGGERALLQAARVRDQVFRRIP
jgi:phage terminase large subunit-like protein